MNDAFFVAVQAGLTPVAYGAPGVGKTSVIRQFAAATGRELEVILGVTVEPPEVGGYPRVVVRDDRHVMAYAVPEWVARIASDPRKYLVFYDEMTCVRPATQAAFLYPIGERRVAGVHLPPHTWQCGAANPPEQAADGQEFAPPLANRVVHLQWETDPQEWAEAMMAGGNWSASSKFPLLPADWTADRDWGFQMVGAFLRANPTLHTQFPADLAKQSGAWPSPRSWEYAALALGGWRASGTPQGIRDTLLIGCVGRGAALEMVQWLDNLDLPDPAAWMRQQIDARKRGDDAAIPDLQGADKYAAFCAGILSVVRQQPNKDHWETGIEIVCRVASRHKEVVFPFIRQLVRIDGLDLANYSLPQVFYELFQLAVRHETARKEGN